MGGICLIFQGTYILGGVVGTCAFHFICHFRSKVLDESPIYIEFACRGTSVETWPCTSQFLKLGPEILTCDLNQAKTKVQVKCDKKLKSMDSFPPQASAEFWAGRRRSFFLYTSLHVLLSLFQITCQNFLFKLKNWVWYCDVVPIRASCPAHLMAIS